MATAIQVGDPAIRVIIKRSTRANRLILRVPHTGHEPVLTLPQRLSDRAASDFLNRSESWLRSRLATIEPAVRVGAGTILPFRGRSLRIEHADKGRMHLQNDTLHVSGHPGQIPVRVAAFLREQARGDVANGSDELAASLGRKVRRITLRDPRSRWGSCTSSGDLMYSWRLILAPSAVLQYVVAHEVAHLQELNHSTRFWSVVENLCPDFATQRQWLRDNGGALHRFSFSAA